MFVVMGLGGVNKKQISLFLMCFITKKTAHPNGISLADRCRYLAGGFSRWMLLRSMPREFH